MRRERIVVRDCFFFENLNFLFNFLWLCYFHEQQVRLDWWNSYSELIRNYNKRYYEICVFRSLFVGGSHEIKITFRSCLLITWWKPSCHIKGTTYSDDRFIVFTSHKLPLFRLTAKFEAEDEKSMKRGFSWLFFNVLRFFKRVFKRDICLWGYTIAGKSKVCRDESKNTLYLLDTRILYDLKL